MGKRKKHLRDNSHAAEARNRSRPYVFGLLAGFPKGSVTIANLKAESPEVISVVIARLRQQPRRLESLFGKPIPTSYDDFLPSFPTELAHCFADEMRWTASLLSEWAGHINEYLAERERFEANLLAGQLDKAEASFNSILTNTGFSLWTIESGLALAELKGGLKENRRFYASIVDNTNDYFAKLTAQFASERVDSTMSSIACRDSFASFVDAAATQRSSDEVIAYISYKSNPLFNPSYNDHALAYILSMDSTYAIIDLYNSFMNVLVYCASSTSASYSRLIREATSIAGPAIHDPRLHHIALLFGGDQPRSLPQAHAPSLEAADAYTLGQYDVSAHLSRDFIEHTPTAFEFYDLHCKSLIHLAAAPPTRGSSETLKDRIIVDVFDVLARTPRCNDAIERLTKTAYLLGTSRFAWQLHAFVRENSPTHRSPMAHVVREINTLGPSARFSIAFRSTAHAIAYIDSLERHFPLSASVQLFKEVFSASGDPFPTSAVTGLPPVRRGLYRAAAFSRRHDTERAIVEYTSLPLPNSSLVYSTILNGLYDLYMITGRLQQCAELVLDAYFYTKELLHSIALADLLSLYEAQGGVEYSADLAWPVLYSIYYLERDVPRDDKRLFVLNDAFLATQGVARPSRLLPVTEKLPKNRIAHFLRYVCVPEILDWSIDYASTDDLEAERVSVCQMLMTLDGESADVYSAEIGRLLQARAIREALRQVDSSKVYVDVNGIRRSLDRSFYEAFGRYRQLCGLEARLRFYFYEYIDVDGKRVAKTTTATIQQVDAMYETFSKIFCDLRDRYVSSSDFGLDSYLSIRIRHGTLVGQLRHVFEEHHLITTVNSASNTYHCNEFWQQTFRADGADEDVLESVDSMLSGFSRDIDRRIDDVTKKWIQVRSNDHPDGLFDFDYTPSELVTLCEQTMDIEDGNSFVDFVFAELKQRAERNLEFVRNAVTNMLGDDLIAIANRLDQSVVAAAGMKCLEFDQQIVQCRTHIQQELELVAGWFGTVGEVQSPDFALRHVVDTSIEMLRRTSAAPTLHPSVNVSAFWTLPGETFTYFVDLFHIILENAVKHSSAGNPGISVEIGGGAGKAVVEISNRIPEAVSTASLEELLPELETRANSSQPTSATRLEGGSGFYKVGKIARSDLRARNLTTRVRIDYAAGGEGTFVVTISFDAEESGDGGFNC